MATAPHPPWDERSYGTDLSDALGGIFSREELDSFYSFARRVIFYRTHCLHIVIASEAKQSFAPLVEKWIASSLTLPCANASRLSQQ